MESQAVRVVAPLKVLPPLSLYVHVPWCVRKCPYCDFNSHEARGSIPEDVYVEALARDLEQAVPLVWGRRVRTVFFGGGTPSLLSVQAVDRILTTIRTLLPLDSDAEITLEANPGTAEAEKFRGFRDAGVNRLSLGIQSFDDRYLTALGRIHNVAEARRAIDLARNNFDNINLDVMYALPQQSLADAQREIRTAIACAPNHISAYHLTLEPNTKFYLSPPELPDEEVAADMQLMIESELASAGYVQYETSAFARAGARCRHNTNYWNFGDYLGIGAGSHGKLSFSEGIMRQMRYKQPKAYIEQALAGSSVQTEGQVTNDNLPFEFMMNALRLVDGVPAALFEERTGVLLRAVEPQLVEAEKRGLLHRDHLVLRPTDLGRRYLNDLLQIFLPDPGEQETA
jgi:putative oxygen-independent coproporphyrinogen III oxidase